MKTVLLLTASVLAVAACSPTSTKTWNVNNVSAAKAYKFIQRNPDAVVLDIRTPKEYEEGHVKDALNINFKSSGFAGEVAKLDKGKTYVVYCRSGNRSGKSMPVLKRQGLGKVYHIHKGFKDWKASGLPVEK